MFDPRDALDPIAAYIRARYAPGWRKSSRGCNAPSCHRGNIIARFHVTHVPSDARTRFRSSWQSAIEAVHQGLRAMRFAVDEGTWSREPRSRWNRKVNRSFPTSNALIYRIPGIYLEWLASRSSSSAASGIIAEEILYDLERSIFSIRSLWIFRRWWCQFLILTLELESF